MCSIKAYGIIKIANAFFSANLLRIENGKIFRGRKSWLIVCSLRRYYLQSSLAGHKTDQNLVNLIPSAKRKKYLRAFQKPVLSGAEVFKKDQIIFR